jgi:hypothetical protein
VLKFFLISIVIVPILLGITAANSANGKSRSVLRSRWVLYAFVWMGFLYFLRFKWG